MLTQADHMDLTIQDIQQVVEIDKGQLMTNLLQELAYLQLLVPMEPKVDMVDKLEQGHPLLVEEDHLLVVVCQLLVDHQLHHQEFNLVQVIFLVALQAQYQEQEVQGLHTNRVQEQVQSVELVINLEQVQLVVPHINQEQVESVPVHINQELDSKAVVDINNHH